MPEVSSDLHNLLNSIVEGQIENFDINFEDGQLQGDNFLGEILFIALINKKTNQHINLIVKQTIDGMEKVEFFSTVYYTEINFYETIWPILNKFQATHSLKFNKIAKYYGSIKTKGNEKIALENLRKQNFQLHDKTKVLNKQQFEYIFESYATFHAISCAFREFYPEEFEKLRKFTNQKLFLSNETVSEEMEGFERAVKMNFDHVRSLFVEKNEADIVKAFDKATCAGAFAVFKKVKYTGDRPVLLHGDCWSNNMMFKYDEDGNVVDMRFLDFQMVSFGSPVNDLSYCLYSGGSKEILDQLDDLLKVYINNFAKTLKIFNCNPQKPFTLEELKTDWKKYSIFGFFMGVMLWRTKLLDKNNIPSITDMANKELPGPDIRRISDEYVEMHNKLMKDLVNHLYENKFI